MKKELELKDLTMDKNLIIVTKSKLGTLNRKITKLQKEKENLEKEVVSLKDEIKILEERNAELREQPIIILNKKVKERYKEKIKYYEEIENSLRKDNEALSRLAFDLWYDIARLQTEIVELKK